jgi:sterol desaturase/sphingolipid hydroxylase (fatty acid hydroxylase superfamily)
MSIYSYNKLTEKRNYAMLSAKFIGLIFLVQFLRYSLIAGGLCYLVHILKKEYFKKYYIQKTEVTKTQLKTEFKYSMLSFLILTVLNATLLSDYIKPHTLIYSNIEEYSRIWLVLTIPVLIILNDFYFYWMHRILHHKYFYNKFHQTHHLSTNPTPLASFSFHPVEAILEMAWIFPVVLLIPVNKYLLISYATISFLNNVKGHLGIDIFPSHTNTFINSSKHHSLHHKHFTSNFGLYFLFWDKVFKTERI